MALDTSDRETLLALLDFHVAAGVDLATDETPHDRFAESEQPDAGPAWSEPSPLPGQAAPRAVPAPAPAAAAPALLPAASTAAPDTIAADARALAASARTLPELQAMVAAFDGCTLKASAKQIAFADGVPGSRVMIVGEAPGAEEDRSGKPFVGRAGQLLDRMLESIGLDRTSVYIANVVPWRPPGNRTPTPQEVAICLPFTQRQIELAAPTVLVTLGAPASQTFLGVKEGILKLRGRPQDRRIGSLPVQVLPMLHPAYLLRQPLHKRFAWRDLLLLKRLLEAGRNPGA